VSLIICMLEFCDMKVVYSKSGEVMVLLEYCCSAALSRELILVCVCKLQM